MTDDKIAVMTLDAITGLMNKLPMLEDRKSAFAFLLLTAYNGLRSSEDDEFVRGWLESAIEDVKRNPAAFKLKGAH